MVHSLTTSKVNAKVPQGSVLALTLFFLHINDLIFIPFDAPDDLFLTLTISYADYTILMKSTVYTFNLLATKYLLVDHVNVVHSSNENLVRNSS